MKPITITYGRQPMPTVGSRTAAKLRANRHVRELAPGRAELFCAPEFLLPAGRDLLIGMIEAKRRASTVADPNGDPEFRTSETCDMDPSDPRIRGIQAAICGIMDLPLANAEPLQGQRYAPGQQFKAHSDAFRYDSDDYVKFCSKSGQRTWTAMIYLDRPDEGGATAFPDLGIEFQPEPGTVLMWNNLNADLSINQATRHAGTPVVHGTKRIVTQWLRRGPWA